MRLFTVKEAQELIPVLREELYRVREAYAELELRWEGVAQEHNLSVADQRVREICFKDREICALIGQVDKSLTAFSRLGVLCKGIKQGIFDFPCLLEDRVVYLCWQDEEDEVSFWHEVDTGFAGRKPLIEATKLERKTDDYLN